MRWAKVRCVGLAPLVMHALNGGEEVSGFSVIRDADPDREVNRNLWNGHPSGGLFVPAEYLGERLQYAILVAASAAGKSPRDNKVLGDAYGIGGDGASIVLPADGLPAAWEPSVHRVPNGSSGPLILNLPQADTWSFVMPLWYDETRITQPSMLAVVQRLGEVGIGALSPHQGCGRYGRFKVTEWSEVTDCPPDMTPFMPKQTAEPAAAPVEA